jgi:hypothetical protein
MATHRGLRRMSDRAYRLKPFLQPVEEYFLRKLEASYQYDWQIGQFFSDKQDWMSRYREYSNLISAECDVDSPGVYERFWGFGSDTRERDR